MVKWNANHANKWNNITYHVLIGPKLISHKHCVFSLERDGAIHSQLRDCIPTTWAQKILKDKTHKEKKKMFEIWKQFFNWASSIELLKADNKHCYTLIPFFFEPNLKRRSKERTEKKNSSMCTQSVETIIFFLFFYL